MQVIALSLEKIQGKEDFFCTNPPDSTHNLKKIIMAKWYLSQNQQHQRPFSVKEGMWVKREFFMNCKSRENGVRPILSFFPQPRVHPPYLPFPYPFNFALHKPRPDVSGPGKRKGAQLEHILPRYRFGSFQSFYVLEITRLSFHRGNQIYFFFVHARQEFVHGET